MVLAQLFEHRMWVFVRLKLLGDAIELRLVLVQIGSAYREQLVQRSIDHLFVRKLLAEGIRADAEAAMRARTQVCLQPRLIVVKRGNDRGVCNRKLLVQLRVFGIRKSQRHVMLKEADDSGKLLDGDVGVNLRWILEIFTGLGKGLRHQLFAGNEGSKTLFRRRKFTLHQRESAVRNRARITIGIFLPRTNDLQCQQGRVNIGKYQFAIGASSLIERCCGYSRNSLLKAM